MRSYPSGIVFPIIDNGLIFFVTVATQTSNEVDFLECFGRHIYSALDFGYDEDEEPELPGDLEQLISYMTGTVDSDPDDDGYCDKIISIRTVLKLCIKHAGAGYKDHYHKVVRGVFT